MHTQCVLIYSKKNKKKQESNKNLCTYKWMFNWIIKEVIDHYLIVEQMQSNALLSVQLVADDRWWRRRRKKQIYSCQTKAFCTVKIICSRDDKWPPTKFTHHLRHRHHRGRCQKNGFEIVVLCITFLFKVHCSCLDWFFLLFLS